MRKSHFRTTVVRRNEQGHVVGIEHRGRTLRVHRASDGRPTGATPGYSVVPQGPQADDGRWAVSR